MPLDPRIPLGVQPPQIAAPFEALQTIAQLQGIREQTEARRLAADAARQKAADEAAIRRVFQESGGDVDAAIKQLRTVAPTASIAFEKSVADARKAAADEYHSRLTAKSAQLDFSTKAAGLVTDQPSLDAFNRTILALDPNMEPMLPKTWAPGVMDTLINMGLSAKDRADQRRQGLELFTKGDAVRGLAQIVATVPPEEGAAGVTTILDNAKQLGTPAAVLDLFRGDYPTAIARAKSLMISAEKQAELAGQAAGREQTARHQTAEEAIARGQLAVSRGQLGVAQARERREAAAPGEGGAVKLSAAQQEDVATMLTVEQLIGDVQAIDKEKGLPGVGPLEGRFFASARGSGGETGETLRNKVGNIQGTIAKLRGGASFTPSEQAMLDRYTPTATDQDAVIRTKLASLADFIQKKRANTLRVASGQYTLPETPKDTKKPDTTKDPLGIR
jgi:hypothetical protein